MHQPFVTTHGPYWNEDSEDIAGSYFELIIVSAVPWNCGAFDSMPTSAGVISHLPGGPHFGMAFGRTLAIKMSPHCGYTPSFA